MSKPRRRDASLVERRELLDEAGIARVLRRMAHEIVERHHGTAGVALVGIRTGGLHLAVRLQKLLATVENDLPGSASLRPPTGEAGRGPPAEPELGAVDIALYRDDVFAGLPRPEIGPTELPFKLPGKTLILVDDVLYTGRTIRAALDALMDYGRPRAVQLAVLVDRGHRELPIQADFVGLRVETAKQEKVLVMLREDGEQDRVAVFEGAKS